jgi:hypothetical protein
MTPNGPAVQDLPVTLHVYDTNGEVMSRTAQLDNRGIVSFDKLSIDPSLFYQADTFYNGAKFYSQPQQFTNTQQLTATLPVYEVTTDPGVISISELHYFVQDVGENTATVVEFYIYDNSGDKAYISKPGPDGQLRTIKATIPADATNLRFDGPGLGSRFSQEDTTIYDSDAAIPGSRASTIAMVFDMPYNNGKQISLAIVYPVKNWDVILPDNELRVTDMTDKGLQPLQTTSVRLYTPANSAVAAGGTITFHLSGQPRAATTPGADNRAIIVGVIAILLVAALTYYLLLRMRHMGSIEVEIETDRQTLLETMASLDNQYAAGTIKESEYLQKRGELKEELREIWE